MTEDVEVTARIVNTRFAFTRRCFVVGFAILLLVGLIQASSGGQGVLDEAITGWVTAVPALYLLERWGIPSAQPYLEMNESGLSYGRRQSIGWEAIVGLQVRAGRFGRSRAWFVQRGWRPNGPLAIVLKRQHLPLSSLSRKWWNPEVQDAIQQFAPHLRPKQFSGAGSDASEALVSKPSSTISRRARQALNPDEIVSWSVRANRQQAGWINFNGLLILTNQRVVFLPRWIDALLLGKPWETKLGDIRSVEVAQPDQRKVLAGGSTRRLMLRLHSGEADQYFVVDDVSWVASQIKAAT